MTTIYIKSKKTAWGLKTFVENIDFKIILIILLVFAAKGRKKKKPRFLGRMDDCVDQEN